jgi:hypothetical protein
MKAHVIKLLWNSTKRIFDVAQALSESKLSESHGKKLFPASEASDAMIAMITIYATMKLLVRKMLNELSENSLALSHGASPEI